MPVSSPGREWCPEDGYGRHSGNWYSGEKCDACGQRGPDPDEYLWPGGSGPRWDEPAQAETNETRIARYAAARKDRDQLVKDLKAGGWGPSKISRALGLGRATVGRILGASWTQDHGHGYKTAPRNVSHETESQADASAQRITEGQAAMQQAGTGLEWAGERERAAIEKENGGYAACYAAVVSRATEARDLARDLARERIASQ